MLIATQDGEPGQDHRLAVDESAEVEICDDRCEDRQHDQADLDPVEEEPHEEDQRHDEHHHLPAGVDAHGVQQVDDDVVAAERAEDVGEEGRPEDDEEDQRIGHRRIGHHRRRVAMLKRPFAIDSTIAPKAPTPAASVGVAQPAEDRAEHQHHQCGRRQEAAHHHGEGQPLRLDVERACERRGEARLEPAGQRA